MSEVVVQPGPESFAARTVEDVAERLAALGARPGPGAPLRWTLPTGGAVPLVVDVEEDGAAVLAIRIAAEGGAGASRALEVAQRLAEGLNWRVRDGSGASWRPEELRRRAQRRRLAGARAGLALLGGAMAVVFGLAWAAQTGARYVWLMLALLGLAVYVGARVWAWLERTLGRGGGRR